MLVVATLRATGFVLYQLAMLTGVFMLLRWFELSPPLAFGGALALMACWLVVFWVSGRSQRDQEQALRLERLERLQEMIGDEPPEPPEKPQPDRSRFVPDWHPLRRVKAWIGLGERVEVPAGGSVTQSHEAEELTKLERIIIDPSAEGLTVVSVKVGSHELIEGDGIDAQTFSEVERSARTEQYLPTLCRGDKLSATLHNHTGGPIRVSLGAYGLRLTSEPDEKPKG